MKTVVYIDGFNLYYGALKGTPYKWLDLCGLFQRVLPRECILGEVKYFTARVKALPHDRRAPDRQSVYIRALRDHSGADIAIVEGRFSVKEVRMPLVAQPSKSVSVIKSEEKGSDVNLAVTLLNDAWRNEFDCAAIVSNDADLESALRIVKQQLKKQVLLCTPGAPTRKPIATLTRWSTGRFQISAIDLAACQLPESIGALRKPSSW